AVAAADAATGSRELEAHAVEGERHLRRGRSGHRVDRDQRHPDAEDEALAAVVGHALEIAPQLHDQGHGDIGHAVDLDDSDAADFELAGDVLRRSREQPVAIALHDRAVVADQREAAVDEAQRQVRLARARRARDQHRPTVAGDRARVERLCGNARSGSGLHLAHARSADGSRMMKRAPDGASSRSCTSISPSWPLTIAWAIARPSPECRPKLSPSGLTEWKRLKIASRASCGTPGPSSSMRMRTSSPTAAAAISTRPPGGEKLTALSMIALIARASRSGLPITAALSLRGRAKANRASPVSRRVSQLCTNCSISGPRSTRSNVARASSASVRAASLMSLISRSSRTTSSRTMRLSFSLSSGSS